MSRMRRLRGWDKKLPTTSNRRRSTPGGTARSGRRTWSTAVRSEHWVNCCSSFRNRTASSQDSRGMWTTLWPWDSEATAPGTWPTTASATGSLCNSSRTLSSVMANETSRFSGRSGDGLVDPDPRALTGLAEEVAGADVLVEGENAVHEGLGPRGATRHVDVDRDDLVHALDDGVVVEHPAARGAHAHGDDPLGLDHLVVDLAEHGSHLLAHPAGHDHEVGLAGAGPEHLHAEPAEVEVGGAAGHHLDGAAGQPEGRRPHRVPPGPLHEVFQAGGQEALGDGLEPHQAASSSSSSLSFTPDQLPVRRTGAPANRESFRAGPQSS